MTPDNIQRAAEFDSTGIYRYSLRRTWDAGSGRVCFVMLNPSAADAESDDPTICRCIGFAKRWGFCALEVVNLFAFRTSSPNLLRSADDPVRPENDRCLRAAARAADVVVAAWGVHGAYRRRDELVASLLGDRMRCLGRTLGGHPRHPLYVRADESLDSFAGKAAPCA